MRKIGITGGIGSGKTTICKVFEVLGIPVFYADTEAKSLMTSDPLVIEAVKQTFGAETYTANNELNRAHLASIVFNDETHLAQLNAIVHPAVFRAFDRWVEQIPAHIPYVLKEAALLFESGSYKHLDFNILVTAPTELKLQRVIQRDNSTREQVLARMEKQMGDDQKSKLANHVLLNDEHSLLLPQILELHQQFILG